MTHPTANTDCLLLALMIVFSPAPAAAQAPDLRFERISIDQGLSQNTIKAILQDRLGFLWIGTGDGLNRYDGYRFEVLRSSPTDPNSLSHNRIRTLYEDRDGILWIGTDHGGLNRYDRRTRTFTHYRHDPAVTESLADDSVLAIFRDRGGTLWVATGRGLDRLDGAVPAGAAGTFTHLRHDPADPASLSHDSVRALHEDRAGNLWIGTQGGLDRLDTTSLSLTRYLPDPEAGDIGYNCIVAIHEDRHGRLWLGTWNGLARFDPDSSPPFRRYEDLSEGDDPVLDNIWDIHEDRDGTLWLATQGLGLVLFDPATETVLSRIRHDPGKPASLSGDRVTVLHQDRSGGFWVGTSGAGLNKLDTTAKAFEHYRSDPARSGGLNDEMVTAIHEGRDGILWVGTWNGGLNRIDRTSAGRTSAGRASGASAGRVTHYRADLEDPTRLTTDDVRAILEDSHGALWVGNESGGLHRLDGAATSWATGTFTRYWKDADDPSTLRDEDAWVLFEDRGGTLWVGTYGGGLARYDPETDSFTSYLHDPNDPGTLSHDVVRAIYQDAGGLLWIGTGGGLNRFDPQAPHPLRFERFRHDRQDAASLSSDEVLSILEDRAGNLWIGTHGGGLNQHVRSGAGASFRFFTEEDGLPSNVIYGILEDERGRLWMSTNRGLSRFDPRGETFRNYDVTDGLQSNEFNAGAYFKNRRGEMFFGGINGFNAFFPARIEDNPYVPPVVLVSFKKYNEEVPLETDLALLSSVTLRHHERVFSFELAALSYTAQQRNEYAYRLVGFRDQWTELGTKRDVTFTNLDPGTYTLQVRASNNDGVWNEEGLALEVIVEPPFWRTWWFKTLTALAVLGLLWGSYQAKTRSMRRHNRALEAEIAERRRAEEELEANNQELEARNAEMERFVYTVSHDLKTPLVTIKGFLGFLERDAAAGNTARMKDDVARIGMAADTMHLLLADLLELSRIGRLMNSPEAVALTPLVEETVAMLDGQIAGRGVTVAIDEAMPVVHGDRMRLREVYENLIDNAVKFLGDQEAPRVEVGARRAGDEVLCWVRDNGIGIDTRYQEKVFGLFERLDQQIPGTGVGLALVKRIVEVHGGRSWVRSEGAGRGCTFYFSLPHRADDSREGQAA